ncbi:hypothetical protein AOLI_G00147010 [Acnodon oligacanthus]
MAGMQVSYAAVADDAQGIAAETGLRGFCAWRNGEFLIEVVQGAVGVVQTAPLSRVMPIGSRHICLMSKAKLSARQGSETQRGQHSPSNTAVYSHGNTGQDNGQQSTSPSYRERIIKERERERER